jgi:hypothetical protein
MLSVRLALNHNRTGFSVCGLCGGYKMRITPAVSQDHSTEVQWTLVVCSVVEWCITVQEKQLID